ncbi:MAG: hypothetical protein ACLSAP_04045 [Oscillospiraceae bacterium]
MDRQIMSLILIFIACGVSAILLVIFTSSYFIRSIVVPVREVGKAASKIAANFGARTIKMRRRNWRTLRYYQLYGQRALQRRQDEKRLYFVGFP